MTSFDAIVIGGGHNGLVSAAATLAKPAEKCWCWKPPAKPAVLREPRNSHRVFASSSVAHLLNRLHPEVVKSLELEKHGLKLDASRFMPTIALSADGAPLILIGAYGESLAGASTGQEAWKELRAQLCAMPAS